MKNYLLMFFLILSISVNAQWTQSALGDAQYGYGLYSSGTEVFAATLNGVYSTTDNGNPWFNIGLQNHLVFDVISSGQYILAATENAGPGVYQSSDHGSNWLETIGIANQSVRAFTKNSSHIFACTWGGGIYRSSDDGGTWQSVGLTNVGFQSMYAVGEKIFAGADKIYSSTNNGDDWEDRQLPYPGGDTFCFHYHNGILYAGDNGLYSSTDLGDTWQLRYGVTFDNEGNVIDVKMFKDILSYQNALIASVAFNSIFISYDGGNNWSDFNDGLIADWTFSALAINEPYLWILRDFMGNAYFRPLTNITKVENENLTLPEGFSLHQNFPNPFNPGTKIIYSVPQSSKIIIKVFDVLGNEIETLVNEEKSVGTYELNWNAANLPSGVYLYQLKAGSYLQTKKMILLK